MSKGSQEIHQKHAEQKREGIRNGRGLDIREGARNCGTAKPRRTLCPIPLLRNLLHSSGCIGQNISVRLRKHNINRRSRYKSFPGGGQVQAGIPFPAVGDIPKERRCG